MLHLYLFSTAIFMLTPLLNLLTACLSPPATSLYKDFTSCHPYYIHLSNARVNQYLHSRFPYTGKFETLFLCLFFHLLMT